MKPSIQPHHRLRNLRSVSAALALICLPYTLCAAESADALFARGQQYLKGDGVEANPATSFDLIRQAADQGHAEALAMLGYFYSTGTGVEKIDEEARRYFSLAAEKGSPAGEGNLGLFMIQGRGGKKDATAGVEWMRKAIAHGNRQSAVMLGEIFYFGQHTEDETPDFAQAAAVLRGPAEAGNAAAQNMMGVMLRDGRLGEKDVDGARAWFEKAARQGNGKACYSLAELWDHTSQDRWARIEALRWLMIGESLGEVTATYFLKDVRGLHPPDDLQTAQRLAALVTDALPQPGRR